ELGRRRGVEQVGFWRKILEHPGYDAFWRDQAVDRVLAGQPLKVPVMLVHSLWDQEDIYGAIAVYKAIKPKDAGNDKVFLVLGPGSKLGFAAPMSEDAAFDEYVSDPARPVPFHARPIVPTSYDKGQSWREWLVTDQREASGRTDVLAFTSQVLTAPVKVSGQP